MCSVVTLTGEPVRLLKEPTTTKELRDAVAKALAIPPIQVALWCPELKRFVQNTDALPFDVVVRKKPIYMTKQEALFYTNHQPHKFRVNGAFEAPQDIPLFRLAIEHDTIPPFACDVLFRIQSNMPFHLKIHNRFIGRSRPENDAHVLDFSQGLPMALVSYRGNTFRIHPQVNSSRKYYFVGGALGKTRRYRVYQHRDALLRVPMSGGLVTPDFVTVHCGEVLSKEKDACVIC